MVLGQQMSGGMNQHQLILAQLLHQKRLRFSLLGGKQPHIDLVADQIGFNSGCRLYLQRDGHLRIQSGEGGEHRRQHIRGRDIAGADAQHSPFKPRIFLNHPLRFAGQGIDFDGIMAQGAARFRQPNPASAGFEQPDAQLLLHSLHMEGNCRLG
ncbi:hypothetical protein D3C75_877580 [compost metagenome]